MKLLQPPNDYVQVGQMNVLSSIDLKGHVNYNEHIRWSFDLLKKACRGSDKISSLQAMCLSEAFEGDELELLVASDKNIVHSILIRRLNTQDAIF